MRVRTLTTQTWLPDPPERVFGFFGDAWNLDAITPPWLHFQVLTPRDRTIAAGVLLEYRLRWHGVPLHWLTEIAAWEPPHRFVDRQERGPYSLWVHEHRFVPERGGTRVEDRVDYAVPGGPLEPLLHRLIVGPDVAAIFAYRQKRLQELLGGPAVTPRAG